MKQANFLPFRFMTNQTFFGEKIIPIDFGIEKIKKNKMKTNTKSQLALRRKSKKRYDYKIYLNWKRTK